MHLFNLTVLAAEKPLFEGKCKSLSFPTLDGEYGILSGSSNMIAAVVPGILKIITPDDREIFAVVSDGIIKVEDNSVLLLADTIERPEEIDENRAKRSAEAAKEAILQQKSSKEYLLAQAKLARALSRIKGKKYTNIN